MGGNAASGFQDVASDGEFVGGCANISKRIMQDEVLEMDEFTIHPERSMRVEKMRALQKAFTDGRAGDALVETGKSATASEIVLSRLWMGNLARS